MYGFQFVSFKRAYKFLHNTIKAILDFDDFYQKIKTFEFPFFILF